MSIPVTVGYDSTNGFTFDPDPVSAVKGTDSIVLNRDAKHPGWKFHGFSIWPSGEPGSTEPGSVCAPFDSPAPVVHDHHITVVDTNPGGAEADYNYRVWIKISSTGAIVSSDPKIINKPGG